MLSMIKKIIYFRVRFHAGVNVPLHYQKTFEFFHCMNMVLFKFSENNNLQFSQQFTNYYLLK